MQIVSLGFFFFEISNSIFWTLKKNNINLSSAKLAQRMLWYQTQLGMYVAMDLKS